MIWVSRRKPPISFSSLSRGSVLGPRTRGTTRYSQLAVATETAFTLPVQTSPPKMVAQKIDGTAIAKSIRVRINAEIKDKQRTNPRYKPSLVIIQGILKLSMLSCVLC